MLQNTGLEISIFLFAALVGYVLAVRVGQSAVVWMILIGMLLGPGFTGLVGYDGTVEVLAEIGAILLLFVIGLESDFKDIYSAKNGLIAIAGVVVPFAGGFLLSRLFGFSSVTALFVGTALTATSIAITAHVLKEMGQLGSGAAKAIIGAAVIDDVLGLLMLGITTGIGKGSFSFGALGVLLVSAVIFFVIAVLLMPVISEIISRVNEWAESKGSFQITILLAMAVAFAYSAVAELIGLSAIVGAFIAGVTLENLEIKSYREGAAYLEMIFSAIFFVSLGLLIDLKDIGAGSWLFIAALIAVAVATKVAGCFFPALFAGLKPRDALIVGVGMVPRGEVAMIVALFGLTAGIISQGIYAAIVVMALVTTIIVPVFLRRLYSGARAY
ncbi:cation:proton antiporter [Candidatus Woesearchaeota archaeon]|nr:cation:proton antiporter [Candidatus Woesearchaeota archaeon]